MGETAPVITVGNYGVSRDLLLDLTKIRAPFDDIPVEHAYTGKKLALDWKLHLLSENSKTGYDGALFSTEIDGKPHYFLYHQGSNNVKDIPSSISLANGKPPVQLRDAEKFNAVAYDFIARSHPDEKVPVMQVGYSLGGALAILTAGAGQPVIAFDAPGTKSALKDMEKDPDRVGKNVLEVLSPHANATNAQGRHVGAVLYAGQKFWKAHTPSVNGFIDFSVQTHRLKNIGLGLADMPHFTAVPAKDIRHPDSVAGAFRDYVKDYKGESPSIKTRLLALATSVLSALRLDRLSSKILIAAADSVGNLFTNGLTQEGGQQDYSQPPVTHPEVEHAPAVKSHAAPASPASTTQETTPTRLFAERFSPSRRTALAATAER